MENKIKILVVDDSEPTRKFIGSILSRDGYNVDYAENGITALEKLFISKYDIVITDINMPGMDGFELIVKLRKDEMYKNTPIVLLTTESSVESIEQGIKIGADLYLIKPTSPDKIRYSIKEMAKRIKKEWYLCFLKKIMNSMMHF